MNQIPIPATLLTLAAAALVSDAAVQPSATGAPRARPREPLEPFLSQHCADCHDTEAPEGQFHLNELSADFASSRTRWELVHQKLTTGAMPPNALPRPPEEEVRALTDWIADRTANRRRTPRRRGPGGPPPAEPRRVHQHGARPAGNDLDLRGQLALDGSMDGFDNVGSALHLSSFALERYLEAADAALNVAIASPGAGRRRSSDYSLKNQHAVKIYGNEFYRVLDDGTVVMFVSTHDTTVWLSQFYPRERGNYRFRISASGFQSSGKPVTFAVHSSTVGLVGYFDVPADKPTVIEFVDPASEAARGSIANRSRTDWARR